MAPLVSIIVPCKKIDAYIERCVASLEEIDYQDKEIIVVTDELCPGFPAGKRNWAMQRAKGNVFCFVDGDAFVSKDWLKNALYWLQCYPAVCGPGVLPPDAPLSEHIADQVHKMVFCPYRVTPKSPRIVSWFPTFNLIVKKESATLFDSYLTGEDDKFGVSIKGGIFYHPDILVYHNRRGIFRPLWKQFATWGRHKGAFVGMAFVAWVTTIVVYAVNWVKGFVRRKPF
jgi:glycosyltransferase involved in cell wall biosynthesis